MSLGFFHYCIPKDAFIIVNMNVKRICREVVILLTLNNNSTFSLKVLIVQASSSVQYCLPKVSGNTLLGSFISSLVNAHRSVLNSSS